MFYFYHHIGFIYLLDSILQSSTKEAEEINSLNYYFMIAASFIMLTVLIPSVYIIYKFRHKKENEYTPKSLSSKWEFLMIGVPLALVIVFFSLTLNTMQKVLPSAEGKKPDVVVTGHQWWWEARYPGQQVVAANEIHLPAGKRVLLKLQSADVIHDWWIPELGNKMDLISGRANYLWLTIKKPGVYQGACSEFCGAQHAGMRLIVVAQTEDDFNKWLALRRQPATPSNESLAQLGAKVFETKTCGNCHAINGTNAKGRAGPDLTHLASRQTLLTGILQNNKENLSRWLRDPQLVKPGANMPNFLLDKQSLDALVAYLSSLK